MKVTMDYCFAARLMWVCKIIELCREMSEIKVAKFADTAES